MKPLLLSALLVSCVATAACSRSFDHYIASGDEYFRQGKYKEAAIDYANAVIRDEQSGIARYKLAEAYFAAGNTKAAFPQYIRAADLLPDNMEAQFKAGHLLLKGGLLNDAKARARTILQRDPNNAAALLLLGNVLAGLKDLDEAIAVLQRAVVVDPEGAGVYTNLGVLQLAKGEQQEAEAAFRKAIEVSNGSAAAYAGLGNFHWALRQYPEAERALKEALARSPNDIAINRALASLYQDWGKPAEAESFLKTAMAVSKDVDSTFALADYYLSVNRLSDAVATLETLAANPAHFVAAKTRIALTHFAAGRQQDGHAAIDEALARQPGNTPALTMKARLFLADRDLDNALRTAKRAVELDPRFAPAQLVLGRVQLALDDANGARKAFAEALALDQTLLPAQLELVELHRRRQEFDTALGLADQAIRTHPTSLPARLARVRVLMTRTDALPRAKTDLDDLLAQYPTAAAVHNAVGAYALATGNRVAARQAFERSFSLSPSDNEALSGLVALDLTEKNLAAARGRVEAAMKTAPDAFDLLMLAAKVYHVADDPGSGETALRRAIKAAPSRPEPYGMLAQLYVAQGKMDLAKREFTELARLDPRWVGAPTMLGVLYYATGDVAAARDWWEKAVRLDPSAAAPSNNLAWLLAETGGDLNRALELARAARAKAPGQPEVTDTLGWVYYKRGQATLAIEQLLLSVEKEPKNATYQFHLGMAYALNGEDAKARRALQAALSLDPRAPFASEARQALGKLVY